MKQRTITGILIVLICIPFMILGGNYFAIFVGFLSVLAIHEAMGAKEHQDSTKKIPLYIKIISYIFMLLLIFGIPTIGNFTLLSSYSFNFKLGIMENFGIQPLFLVLSMTTLLICSVCDKRFEIMDAIYVIGMLFFISTGLKGLIYLRSLSGVEILKGVYFVLYIIIITCFTDTFAYLGGMTCYRLCPKVHKLNERISPKKTWEGTLIGSFFGILGGILAFILLVNPLEFANAPIAWYYFVPLTILLTVMGQFGDLILSAVKRHFEIKDFSHILPGHGGILDRLDSLLINSMIAATFISLIL